MHDFIGCNIMNCKTCREIDEDLERAMTKDFPKLVFAPASHWGKVNEVAIHLLEPTQDEQDRAYEQAVKDLFPQVIVYTSKLVIADFKAKTVKVG